MAKTINLSKHKNAVPPYMLVLSFFVVKQSEKSSMN